MKTKKKQNKEFVAIKEDVFSKAFTEIGKLLLRDGYPRFVQSKNFQSMLKLMTGEKEAVSSPPLSRKSYDVRLNKERKKE